MKHNTYWIALLLAVLFVTGCSKSENNNPSDDTKQSSVACVRGQLNCACDEGQVCDLSDDGEQLACILGICEQVPCEAGSVGCACDSGSCGDGLTCSDASGVERCEVDGCELGAEGCGCQLDRQCNSGLTCQQGTCKALDCTVGAQDCACSRKFTCETGLTCELDTQSCETSEVPTCTLGNLGCDCKADGSCVSGLTCQDGVCDDPTCPAGLEGCACQNDACGFDSEGEQLECTSGICQSSDCPAGDNGCVCINGLECNDESAECKSGYCKSTECIPGSVGCDCLAGSCNPGLECQDDSVCVDKTGKKGGPCYDNGTCERNNRCDDSVLPAVCVYCDLGTIGCQCQDDESCLPGLSCVMDHCVGDETVQNREPNTDAECQTPCTENLVDESGTRVCVDGFIEGCVDDLVCDKNSCVKPDSEAEICFTDSDCPSFQLCMQGYCYIECSSDVECESGTYCQDKVCRTPCSLDAGGCDSGYTCESDNGETGFCMKNSSSTGTTSSAQEGGFELSLTEIPFTNTRVSTEIILYNNTNDYVNYTFRKVEHDVLYSDGSRDKTSDYAESSTCSGQSCPMWWVELGEFGQITEDREVIVRANPNCREDCPRIVVRIGNNGEAIDATRWRGVIEVQSEVGSDRIDLSYVSSPQGRWAGKMVYFANFESQGIDTDGAITGWLDKANRDDVSGVANGLIQKWGAFRTGGLSGGWTEMKAVLSATRSGAWQWPSVTSDCIASAGACYLFDSGGGAVPKVYVTLLDAAPIPTGVSEFPMAINIYRPDATNSPEYLEGRVVTETALHYADDPKIELTFNGDPADTGSCDPSVTSNCVNFIDSLDLKVKVGGRYDLPSGQSSCTAGFEYVERPWLVPGFLSNAYEDSLSGLYRRGHCVDGRLPFYPVGSAEELTANTNLARSNPIPNGKVLDRQVEILDGAMIDQTEIIILFRERFPSFLNDDDVMAYGYMVLQRQAVQVEEDDDDADGIPDQYEAASPPESLSEGTMQTAVTCSDEVLDEILGTNVSLNSTNAPDAIRTLINGGTPSAASVITPGGTEEVHYLCEDTGLFDGGPDNTADWGEGYNGQNNDNCATAANGICEDGELNSSASTCVTGTDVTDCGWRYTDTRIACPAKSKVIYFTANSNLLPNIHNESCQDTGTCMDRLNNWINSGNPIVMQVEPKWTCEGDSVFCDDNTQDRREGKVFYKAGASDITFLGLRAEMADAFRYKTRFLSRDGSSSVGFSPSICVPFSTTTPYCYDPEKIEGLRERIDCLLYVYDSYYDSFSGSQRDASDELYEYLEENFSYREEPNPLGGLPTTYDGFERLYAELLIMLGDEAYTSAFESRFDLAGSLAASFEGSKLEDDGIDLSGVAGYEIYKLYQAVQYYDMVLDRFYSMGSVIGAALASGSPSTARNFISSGTVTSYFDRLIRASTQRSRALAEISRRYQALNRSDLARRVAERAFTATYIESVFLANLIIEFYEISGGSQRPQILSELEKSQLRYRTAMVDLASVYGEITSEINYFGFPADYVPFPALDNTSNTTAESNAFEKVLRTALSKLDVAKAREQNALQQTRSYETDEASFQAELTRITRTYENQLAEICGTFVAQDGLVYPAVETYAYLDDRLAVIGDPCGFAGNGAIHKAIGELDLARLEVRRLAVQAQNIFDQIEIERTRVNEQCDLQLEIADYNYEVGEDIFNLEEDKIRTQQTIDFAMRRIEFVKSAIEIVQCAGEECIAAGPALTALTAVNLATEVAIQIGQSKAAEKRAERNEIELDSAKWNTLKQCDAAEINGDATVATMMLGLRDIEISMFAADYRISLAMSEVEKLRNQAARLNFEWQESLDTSINIEAAKNDPNIRIYRNDAVINADISFEDAIREAYRLTIVYEYYTSTSYINRDQLFLIRMVSSGDYNLENYIYDIKNAFIAFEETFGIPELRVEMISLRDDILNIPLVGDDGTALSIDDRSAMLRERLQDPGLLNSNGYLSIPFRTNIERLSPLTRNHKIFYVESNIEGNDNGDFLGRLYLRQVGTSVIRSIENEYQYYRFPPRTAVINPFFNGIRQFSQSNELYRSYRLREFPLVNTDWELIINQRDEAVNQDINLDELTDVKLYIFYTDFTVY